MQQLHISCEVLPFIILCPCLILKLVQNLQLFMLYFCWCKLMQGQVVKVKTMDISNKYENKIEIGWINRRKLYPNGFPTAEKDYGSQRIRDQNNMYSTIY